MTTSSRLYQSDLSWICRRSFPSLASLMAFARRRYFMLPAAFRSWTSLASALCSRSARLFAARAWRRATLCHSPRQFPDPCARRDNACGARDGALGLPVISLSLMTAKSPRRMSTATPLGFSGRGWTLSSTLSVQFRALGKQDAAHPPRPGELAGPGTRPAPRSGRGGTCSCAARWARSHLTDCESSSVSSNEAWAAVRRMTWSGAPGRPGLGSGISITGATS